jgi:eukaryotic-like serine/threonine-protein kinase
MSVAALTASASPLTQKGTVVGTFQFMAPEVLQGAAADARSDIFSFGCVF